MQSTPKLSPEVILNKFHVSLIAFLDELIEQFSTEASLILYRIFLKDKIQKKLIMETFIREAFKYRDDLLNHNENVFLHDDFNLFHNVGSENINHFQKLWKSDVLNDDDRKVIWDWLDTFMYLADQYQSVKN